MKKIILFLVFIVNVLTGYSGSIYLLGQTDHRGISVEVWKYDGTLVDTATTNVYGSFTIRYADTYTYYKLVAIKSGYHSITVDSVRASYGSWYSDNDGPLRTIDFDYGFAPVLIPVSGLKVLKGFLDADLTDTTVLHFIEKDCRIAKDIKVGPGVKICFNKNAAFYIENKFKIVFEGSKSDSIRFLPYPIPNGDAEGAVKLDGNSKADFSFCSFNKSFNVQSKNQQTRASFKNNKIQTIDIFCRGIIELSNNQIDGLKINQAAEYYDYITPEIVIENNRIGSLYSSLINGPAIIKDNNFIGSIQIDTALTRLRIEGNILKTCTFNYINGIDFTCNKIYGVMSLSSYSTEGNIFISDNAFTPTSTSSWDNIVIRNDQAGIEIKNNFFSIRGGRLKIRPGDYQWSATRSVLFENNTVSGDVVFINDDENLQRDISLFKNVFGGDVLTGELQMEHYDNLYKYDVLCFCEASAQFSNTLGYKTDRYNNIYSESISFINDTLPFLKESVEGIERRLGVKVESSCLHNYYKNSMTISDDHSISGKISSEASDFTLAYVAAINKNNGKTSIQKTNNDGTYIIKGLKKGEYLLYAIPRDTSYYKNGMYVTTTLQKDYFPTYFFNKLDSKLANKVILIGDITEANISLIKNTQSNVTNDVVIGTILYKDTTFSDAGTDWMGSSMGDNPFFALDTKHYACQNLLLYAEDENGAIVGWAKTTGGGFIFTNLPAGKLKIKAQRIGFHLENEETFIVERGMSKVVGYLVKDDVSSTTGILPIEYTRANNVTPNPFQERFILNDILNDEEINVYDIMGKLMLNQITHGEESLLIDGSSWPAGIYFVKSGDKISKIIKE
ncbi:MAG: T9SS type A sorting domain-containing protein [Sporocytophaga sp.]|uniref:T9SS type A sorting domain-containing protein n=1 Tax=Sporocytophaga sp. TaxID=2231183 RepID=UPI001B06B677|nr:T9SS type A sorting domain-containing protein [Sporocytophaga sp.]MBO9703563.1 T9SS type A sorting domain-containing protein [Sporocytophaga sp.]